tara:strand:+ start:111 stop:1256 length:1146 start_codon:yes stop_codon:yes gene_type:complete
VIIGRLCRVQILVGSSKLEFGLFCIFNRIYIFYFITIRFNVSVDLFKKFFIDLEIIVMTKLKVLRSKKIYITGHRGMVGSALMRYFKKNKVNKLIYAEKKKLDLLDKRKVENFIKRKKPDIIVNCAGRVGGILANSSYPVEFLNENIEIQLNLINASFKNKIKHFINLGSSCIYPNNFTKHIKEEFILTSTLEKTNEAYALAKIMGLKLCEFYNKQYRTNYLTLMPCNLYGPNDNFNSKNSHFIPALIKKFVDSKYSKKKFVEIWGSGLPKREIMHVDDLADAISFIIYKKLAKNKLLLNLIKKNSVINVGSGQELTIKKFANLINLLSQSRKKLRFNKKYPDGTKRKILDLTNLRKLGWKPKISIENGLIDTIKWYTKNK